MTTPSWVRALASSLAVTAACFSSSSGGPASAEATDAELFDAEAAAIACAQPPDAGACNAIPELGGTVTGTCETTAEPQGTGGTIADGTYVLTARVGHGSGCTATTFEATMVIAGGCVERIDGTGATATRRDHTIATSGNALTRTATCGSALPAATYTATPTGLVIFDEGGAVTTWTRM